MDMALNGQIGQESQHIELYQASDSEQFEWYCKGTDAYTISILIIWSLTDTTFAAIKNSKKMSESLLFC